ncbi:carbohydrate ABC transporter permease [Streptomyces sp. NBC_00154]|uniref:carbohydrate ABC transporter permease n=1 Tax=Streptomyces sp. NBC_00154 TaxID=2975670 RepID=UPI00224E95C3|nr:sugar ABC transporter permease [Streptomyces sp. NBC_00154]MCX5315501.1 sugar ABC transporter permease [Streptomyces sp. NBC_00154]
MTTRFYVPAVLYLVIFFGYPIVANLVMSFQDYTVTSFYNGGAPFTGLANYAAILTDELFSTTLWNTTVFTIASLILQFAIGLGLALFFRRRFPLGATLRALLLLPWLLPLLVSGTVFRWLLAPPMLPRCAGVRGPGPCGWPQLSYFTGLLVASTTWAELSITDTADQLPTQCLGRPPRSVADGVLRAWHGTRCRCPCQTCAAPATAAHRRGLPSGSERTA